jgi:limonene-1,2-epoxide hydrolase
MSAEHEGVVCEFLAAMEGSGQWEDAQVDRMLSFMAPEAKYYVYAWEEPHVGHAAIRAEWRRQAPSFRDVREQVVTIVSAGATVFTERLDVMTINGTRVDLLVAGVFELDANNKIAVWRDYGDRKEVAVKLGLGATGESGS